MTLRDDLLNLADAFDKAGLLKEASALDAIIKRFADVPLRWTKENDTTYFEGEGVTRHALKALDTVLKNHAKDLVSAEFQKMRDGSIFFIGLKLMSKSGHTFMVPAGFADGYGGTGPAGFREAKQTLAKYPHVKVTEVEVDKTAFEANFHNPWKRKYEQEEKSPKKAK